MKLWRMWGLRGPNAWAACPVLETGLDLGQWTDLARDRLAQVVERVSGWLPALAPPPVGGANRPGDRGKEFACLAHLVERVAIHLRLLVGNPVSFGATRPLPQKGRYRVAVEFRAEPVARAAVQAAIDLCRAACEGRPYPIDEELGRLRDIADDERLGPSTLAIVMAARARGIPVDHLDPDDGRYLQLGHGACQRRTLAAETDDISAIARSITTDKHLTKLLLRAAGVPVPQGRPVTSAEDAWTAACEVGLPVAVKPQDRDLAVGVGLDLRTPQQVMAAYHAAREKSSSVMVERFARGTEHRVLVVDGRVVAVARIEPPHVVGDGHSTVAELVEAVNRDPRRGPDHHTPLRRLKLDAVALEVLAAQGYTLASIPPRGERVLVRRNPPYIKNGGSLSDLTDRIHPAVAARAVAAARALHLRVAGLDVVVEDIGRPLEAQGGVVVEVNTGPGLWLHMAPWADTPRPVGEAIVATLFPPGSDGRIPLIAITGAQARSTAGSHLAALLASRGLCTGRAGSDNIFIADTQITMSGTAREKARAVLQNNLVESAILEASPHDLLREGLGCDRCDVAVVTDLPTTAEGVSADTDGNSEELAEGCGAVLHALAPGGKAVLNAEDAPVATWPAVPADRIVWFARDGESARLLDHRAAGGQAVFLRGESVVLARGSEERTMVLGVQQQRRPDEVVGLLAALSAGIALDLSEEEIRTYLAQGQLNSSPE
jgi:cyanophycin synthetase